MDRFLIRAKKLQQNLSSWKVEGLLVEDPLSLFYLTGLLLSRGRLCFTKNEIALFVDGRYIEVCKKKSPYPVFLSENGEFCDFFRKEKKGASIAFESNFVTYASYVKLKKVVEKIGLSLVAIDKPLKALRAQKDLEEIASIKRAARITMEGFSFLLSLLKEGISEEGLAREFEFFCRKKGAEKLAFSPIIAFGVNSARPHHLSGKTILKRGDVILMDLGVVVDGYHSDMTRTVFFQEKQGELSHFSELVQRAFQAALSLCKPGAKIQELDLAARKVFAQEGLEDLFIHRLGHGVGLEIHEFPSLRREGEDSEEILKESMVITLEPGLYKEGLGGIRHEDMILITSAGYEKITF